MNENNKNEKEGVIRRLLRKKEVAQRLACSTRTVDRLVATGRLTAIRLIGGVRYRPNEVEAIVEGGAL